jgi:hypothetical protein
MSCPLPAWFPLAGVAYRGDSRVQRRPRQCSTAMPMATSATRPGLRALPLASSEEHVAHGGGDEEQEAEHQGDGERVAVLAVGPNGLDCGADKEASHAAGDVVEACARHPAATCPAPHGSVDSIAGSGAGMKAGRGAVAASEASGASTGRLGPPNPSSFSAGPLRSSPLLQA